MKEEPTEPDAMYVMTADGLAAVSEPKYVLSSEGLYEIPYEKVEEETETDEEYIAYTFHGHGWGHLVGMSQWGAFSMAVEGFGYRDILNFYFTDIEIVENKTEKDYEENEFVTDDETHLEEDDEYEEVTEAESEDAFSDTDVQWSDTGI